MIRVRCAALVAVGRMRHLRTARAVRGVRELRAARRRARAHRARSGCGALARQQRRHAELHARASRRRHGRGRGLEAGTAAHVPRSPRDRARQRLHPLAAAAGAAHVARARAGARVSARRGRARVLRPFAAHCGSAPRNSGIRGLPPGFCLETALRAMLDVHPVQLASELDEQGLQAAALARCGHARRGAARQVAVCSPFPPHLPGPGSCGVHFVGLNAKRVRWIGERAPGRGAAARELRAHRANPAANASARISEAYP